MVRQSIFLLMASLAIVCNARHHVGADGSGKLPPALSSCYGTGYAGKTDELRCVASQSRQRESARTGGYVHAVLTQAGTLSDVIGDKILDIDSVTVEGPVNEADFTTLWKSSLEGHLKVINLLKAEVENGMIPAKAMFHPDEQVDWDAGFVRVPSLEKLILPEGTVEIGEFAFSYATFLTDLGLPPTVKKIGDSAFSHCVRLAPDPFVLPESLEEIGEQAFYECRGLKGEVLLPPSLRILDSGAFYLCGVSKADLPPALEYLSCFVFAGCNLKEASLPDDCYLCPHGSQFSGNWLMEKAHIPDNTSFVPDFMFNDCMSLSEVNIPSRAESIGDNAFHYTSISQLELPGSLKTIGHDAFGSCRKLSAITLPASLTNIGDGAFENCSAVGAIYSHPSLPPVADVYGDRQPDPFRYIPHAIPVYIPKGSKEYYCVATGWEQFSNFVETDRFPFSSVESVIAGCKEDGVIYDISGRIIQTPVPGQIYIRGGKKMISKQ